MTAMRLRKLIGTVLLIVWVVFYALVAMIFLAGRASGYSALGQLAAYSIAGVAWLPVAMLIIWWMARDKARG